MNHERALVIARVALGKEKELRLTNNERTGIERFLGISSSQPCKKHGAAFNSNYMLNNFEPLIRDMFPNEYATL